MAFLFVSDADELSWPASTSFFNSYDVGCTNPFSSSYFGPLVFLLINLHICLKLVLPFDKGCSETFLLLLISDVISCEGGGNHPAVAVPLVALGTQSGMIDVIDASANAVASSLSVHNGIVRGLRWLGNSRVVSFSYTQVYLLMILVLSFLWCFIVLVSCLFFRMLYLYL